MAVVLLVGVVDVKYLKKIRPYLIIGCFVVGMILTPPDIFSETLLALPTWLLFEKGVNFGRLIRKRNNFYENAAEAQLHRIFERSLSNLNSHIMHVLFTEKRSSVDLITASCISLASGLPLAY